MDRDMKLDKLLRQAGERIDYRDGSAAGVWVRAARAEPRRARPLRWLVPLAAAVTVLITMAAVPEARAAVGGLLGRLFDMTDYMVQSAEDRPENSAVAGLVQPGGAEEPAAQAQSGGDWIKDVKVTIVETLYDGEFVYLKYTVDSNGVANFMGGYDALTPGQNVGYKEFRAGSVTLPDNSTLDLLQGGERDMGGGIWMDVVKYKAGSLVDHSGKIDLVFTVQFNSIVETDGVGACTPAGDVALPFTLDLDAGNSSLQTLEPSGGDVANVHLLGGDVIVTDEVRENGVSTITNRQTSLGGCKLIVESITRKPTETRVTLRFVPSEAFAEFTPYSSKDYNLYPVLMNGDAVVGDHGIATPQDDGSYLIEITAPLLPEDVKTLMVKTVFLYAAHLNGEEMTIGKSFTLGDSWDNDMVPQPVEGGTFGIALTD